jgi:hypothetical protein
MKNLNSISCRPSFYTFVALLLTLFLAACATTTAPTTAITATTTPSEATTAAPSASQAPTLSWLRRESIDYEKDNPGFGKSDRYASTAGWVDVFTYDLRRNTSQTSWQSGVKDPQFSAHFESTIDEVREIAKRGTYTNLKINETKDITISGQAFRTVSFTFERNGRLLHSATYLTATNGQLLKYRISIYEASKLDIQAVAQTFIEENLRTNPGAKNA